jgi:hypothetical protein
MPLDVPHQLLQACALMMTRAFIVYVPKGAFYRVGTRTIRGQKEQGKPLMVRSPLRDGLRFMHCIVVYYHIDPAVLGPCIAPLQGVEEGKEHPTGLALSVA